MFLIYDMEDDTVEQTNDSIKAKNLKLTRMVKVFKWDYLSRQFHEFHIKDDQWVMEEVKSV